MRIAIIDLGTNTFNLLIAKVNGDKSFALEYSTKQGVKLGKGGINQHTILPDAMERGLQAVDSLMEIANRMGVAKTYAFATSAIRSASNGHLFVDLLKEKHSIQVEVITGNREAELIYRGVNQAVDLSNQKHLIMDIGGGSNELIIANSTEIFFKHSFPIGISRLLEKFSPSDPITAEEVKLVEAYLEQELQLLFEATTIHQPKVLIGSSGSFDTYRSLLSNGIDNCRTPSIPISMQDFNQLHQMLLCSTMEERLTMPGMETMRVEMIVLASIFTKFVVDKIGITQMVQSSYALKEGAIWDIVHKTGNTKHGKNTNNRRRARYKKHA